MASPVVQAAIENSTNTAGTSHTLTGLTWTADQLMLIILDKGSTSATISQSSGPTVTELLDEASGNGLYIAYRFIQSGDTGNIVLTSSASTRTASITYRISGASRVKAPEIGTTGTGSSATPDPPASTAPAAARDCLIIAFAGMAGEELDDDTWGNTPPTGYTPSPPRQKSCGTAGTNLGGLILSAEKAITGMTASDNPGTFGVDASAAWRSQTITVYPHLEIDAASASFTLTGAETTRNLEINAAPGSYTLTGVDATIVAGRVVDAQPGSYALSGSDAAVVAARMLNAELATFVVTGFDATLVYAPLVTDFPINAEPGSFAVTGVLASVVADRMISVDPGSYAVAGQVAGVIADRVLSATPGAFALSGADAAVIADRAIAALEGVYTVNGAAATLVADRVIQASPGEYVITGVLATLDYSGAAPVALRLRTMLGVGL